MATLPPSAAHRVFGIVRLAEQIVLQRDAKNVLTFQRVAAFANQVVKTSTAIEEKLHLAPAPDTGERRLAPLLPKHIGLHLTQDYACLDIGRLKITVRWRHASRDDTWKKVLLIQPPVKRLLFDLDYHPCTGRAGYSECGWACRGYSSDKIFNPHGITLGDADDFAQEILEYSAECDNEDCFSLLRGGCFLSSDGMLEAFSNSGIEISEGKGIWW